MSNALQPFHLRVIALAGWLNRQQQVVIDSLIEENRVLKEQLEGQRLRFTDEQRIRLAVKAKVLGRRGLDELETLVTPDTLLAWHRKLVAQKWTYARKGPGRPPVAQEITDLVLRMARENTSWGYDRIQGALANLGHIIAPNTVKNIIEAAWHRAGAGAGETHLVEDVLKSTLGRDGRYGFLHGRGPDTPRSCDLLRIVYHPSFNTFRTDCRRDRRPKWCIHETGGSQSDRRE